jgi:hypothetical protein
MPEIRPPEKQVGLHPAASRYLRVAARPLAGLPKPKSPPNCEEDARPAVRPLGSFEEWTRVIGGILEFSGATGFLANIETNATEMDSEDSDWAFWLKEAETVYPEGFTVPQLLSELQY